jgi:uncharacterized membrane protein YkvI
MEVIFVEEKSNILTILKIAGTYISCCMGAGFATGQEVMQFFTSYGYLGILGLVGVVILFAWYGWVFMKAGNELKATSAKPVLEFLCGKKLGIVVEWITMSFVFACFSALVSGAGTTLNQYFGINSYLAKVIVTLAICLTALLGLNSIINIISAIAPIAIVLLIIIAIYTISTNPEGLLNVGKAMEGMNLIKAAPTWWISMLLYVSYCVLPFIPTLSIMGATTKNKKDAKFGSILGGICLGIGAMLINLSLLSTISESGTQEIPMLYLADKMSPIIGILFSVIIISRIYASNVPLLYSIAMRFSKGGKRKYKLLLVCVSIAGLLLSFVPFARLLNIIYPFFGWLGLIIMAFAVYRTIIKKEKPVIQS